MKTKVFIDGSEGTTGLRIDERFQGRDDIELLRIAPELRKDPAERKKLIHASDITFLCLPDEAARESVALAADADTVIIDASTAHRTESGWAYGFPELSDSHRAAIQKERRIAVPGCYATGFISLVYPLIAGGILPRNYPVSSFAISGYSGAGKKTIAVYESADRPEELSAGRVYALTQNHKHLKEMTKITGLSRTPLFSPIIDDYYSGMLVCVPLYADFLGKCDLLQKNDFPEKPDLLQKSDLLEKSGLLAKQVSPEALLSYYREYYRNQRLIEVAAADDETEKSGFLAGNGLSGWDGLKIYVTGNEERIVLSAQFDNLGKGASGAAIQCMNLVLGCEEGRGLQLMKEQEAVSKHKKGI